MITSHGYSDAQTIQTENYTEQVQQRMNRVGLHVNNILKGLAVETKRQGSALKHQVPLRRVVEVDSTELLSQWPLHKHCAVILSQQKHYEPVVFVSRTDCSL
jgi:hypothetical protein